MVQTPCSASTPLMGMRIKGILVGHLHSTYVPPKSLGNFGPFTLVAALKIPNAFKLVYLACGCVAECILPETNVGAFE